MAGPDDLPNRNANVTAVARVAGVVLAACLFCGVALAGGAGQYRFERLWPSLQQPWYFVNTRGLAIDPDDNVFVVDSFNHRIHRFSRDGQLITRFGQFGIGSGQFNFPLGVATDTLGNIFVAETNDGNFRRIQKISRDGEPVAAFGTFGSGPCEFGVGPGASGQSPFDLIVDAEGNLLVSGGSRVRKFDPNNFTCLSEFGTAGISPTAPGEFEFTTGLGLDAAGRIYVVDGGVPSEIQVFAADGSPLTRFGGFGNGPGQFDLPNDVTVVTEPSGTEVLLVADAGNARVQKFDATCALALVDPANLGSCLVTQWGTPGSGPGQFQLLWRVQVDSAGLVYTVDVDGTKDFGIHRVQKFTSDGVFLTEWTSGGDGPREFANPNGLDVSASNQVYVADGDNRRIQVFSAVGQFVRQFGSSDPAPNQFLEPVDVDVAPDGRVYVLDFGTLGGGQDPQPRVYRFLADGTPDGAPFGTFGTGAGQFQHATDMAIGRDGSLYVVDSDLDRVQKFDANGVFDRQWGGHSECFDSNGFAQACNNGQFNSSRGIAVDRSGAVDRIYVADTLNRRLQVFDPLGGFVAAINLPVLPVEVSIDAGGRSYIVPFSDSRTATGHFVAQVDATGAIVDTFGEFGSNPGQFRTPSGLSFGADGRGYVVDVQNNRIQVFVPQALTDDTRAIIVTGGGPYPGNALWQATQLNANFTYRTLVQQGFGKDRIAYLSADTDLDLDQNGLADDVDGDATNTNLADTINGPFAAGASNLLVYMVDHGGLDTFRMSGTQTLGASTLAGWLDDWQTAHPGARVTVVYDACQSGSFVDDLASSQFDRVVIASSGAQESAYFVAQGTLSFSTSFWTQVFNGAAIADAFSVARQATAASFPLQNALLEADGDGTPNTAQDLARVATSFVGNGTLAGGTGPAIGSVSGPQTIANGNSATIAANGVIDDESVSRVWAVLRPPGFNPGSPDNPVQDLPTFDLTPVGGDDYSGQFNGFADLGTWQVAVYAMDGLGNRSIPMVTSVTVDSPLERRAVIVAGSGASDGFLGTAVINSEVAYRALDQQGYGAAGASCSGGSVCDSVCDNVCFLGNGGSAGTDAAPSLANLSEAISTWGSTGVQDLTVYLVAPADGSGGYRLNETQSLDAVTLDGWLDAAQAVVPGTITLIVDADGAGGLIAQTTPGPGERRILMASAAAAQPAVFLQGGTLSFSRFFFNQVLNGATTRGAFNLARQAVRFGAQGPTPQLDDNGNGIANEFIDGAVARTYAIGSGVLLAGDDPLVSTVAVAPALTTDFASVGVSGVTTTGVIDQVILVVTQPGGLVVSQPLPPMDGGYGDRSHGLCGPAGDYDVAAYVQDTDGNVSVPAMAQTSRAVDCTDFGFFSGFE